MFQNFDVYLLTGNSCIQYSKIQLHLLGQFPQFVEINRTITIKVVHTFITIFTEIITLNKSQIILQAFA